jgi:hypothetical protein
LRFKETIGLTVLGLVVMAFFGVCSALAWLNEQRGAALGLAIWVPLGLYVVLGRCEMEITDAGVTRRWLGRTYSIAWHEIVRVATDGTTVLLAGRDKHLPIVPMFWPREFRGEGLNRIREKLMPKGLQVEDDRFASYRPSRNARVLGQND